MSEAIKILHGTGFSHGSVEIYNVDLTNRNSKNLLYSSYILWKGFEEKSITPKFHTLEYNKNDNVRTCHVIDIKDIYKKSKTYNDITENSVINISNDLFNDCQNHIDTDMNIETLNKYFNDILFNFQYESIFYSLEYKNYLMSLNEKYNPIDKIHKIIRDYLTEQQIDVGFFSGLNNEIELKRGVNKLLIQLKEYHKNNNILDKKYFKNTNISVFEYYRDISINHVNGTQKFETLLDTCCIEAESLIHGENSFLSDSPGINKSMFYINTTCGSVTPMHSEITDLPSVAYLMYGAPKIWIIIEECSSSDMKNMFITKYRNNCAAPWEHQTMFFTLDDLDEFHISYKIIVQYPNTLVTLKEGIFHQVLNLGPNILEACNFAGIRWELLHKSRISQCLCMHNDGTKMSKNINITYTSGAPIKVTQSKRITYQCKDENCVSIFTTINELESHIRLIHSNNVPPNFVCLQCTETQVFTTKSNLLRHIKTKHSGKEACPNCNKLYGRLSYHLNKPNECSKKYACVRGKIIKI
ncbi:MAG: jmjC domain-containing protein [Cotesia congregata filamentous virus 2]